jgi:TPR repeat protein
MSPYFKDLSEKKKLLEQMAEGGDITARYYEGVLSLKDADRMSRGQLTEVQRRLAQGEYQTALHWVRPLAEFGDADSQRLVAGMYADGNGVPQSPLNAIDWYSRQRKVTGRSGTENERWQFSTRCDSSIRRTH